MTRLKSYIFLQRPDVFLCHRKVDREFVSSLAEQLTQLLVKPWFDEWEISAGHSLHERIGNAVQKSKCVAFIVSPILCDRNGAWMIREALALAKKTKKNNVIPIICRKSKLLPFLSDRKYLDFTKDYFSALCELSATIRGIDRHVVAKAISKARPTSIAHIERLFAQVYPDILHVGSNNWRVIEEILEKHNVQIGDRFTFYDKRFKRLTDAC